MKKDWIPREHGAWGMIGGAFLSVTAVHRTLTVPMVLFLLGFLALYLTRLAFQRFARGKWDSFDIQLIGILISIGLGFIFFATYLADYWSFPFWVLVLVPFFGIELLFIRIHKSNHFVPQLMGTIGLSFIAALTDGILHSQMTLEAMALWALNSLFFVAGITIVRQQIAARSDYKLGKGYLWGLRWSMVVYGIWGALLLVNASPFLVTGWIVLFPVMVEVFIFSLNRIVVKDLKTLGWLQIAQTGLFIVILSLVF